MQLLKSDPGPRPTLRASRPSSRSFSAKGCAPYRWSNGPGDVYGAHVHAYHKVLYVVTGSITFGLPDEGRSLTLHAGDRLELPPGVVHDAVVGPEGVACLEAHRILG